MTVLVGISGKIGAGKNYLADRVIEKMEAAGFKVAYTSFAAPLKAELDAIIALHNWHAAQNATVTPQEIANLAETFNIPVPQIETLLSFFVDEVKENADLNSYDRTPGIRKGLQYLGSDIRRVQNPNHWIDLLDASIDNTFDYLFATDARFPNEADYVLSKNGVAIRLEVPKEVILSRTNSRDGLKYSEDALNHQSETALDDYDKFDFYVGQDFDAEEVFERIVALGNEKSAN